MIDKIKWLGHASFRIDWKKIIYIDPWEIKEPQKADIILITHSHYDHCSCEDIEKIADSNTLIIAPPDCKNSLSTLRNIKTIAPGEKIEIEDLTVEAIAAYNINKQFHPKNNNWVGYILTLEGVRIYHAGDSDFIPEMKGLNIDIALLPIGGTYTMNAEEAARAVKEMQVKQVIPMHFGKIVGTERDLAIFKSNLPAHITTHILKPL